MSAKEGVLFGNIDFNELSRAIIALKGFAPFKCESILRYPDCCKDICNTCLVYLKYPDIPNWVFHLRGIQGQQVQPMFEMFSKKLSLSIICWLYANKEGKSYIVIRLDNDNDGFITSVIIALYNFYSMSGSKFFDHESKSWNDFDPDFDATPLIRCLEMIDIILPFKPEFEISSSVECVGQDYNSGAQYEV